MHVIILFKGLGSEDCYPLNMSIEAEMAIEQMKEQHHRDLHNLKQELEDTVSYSCLKLHNFCNLFVQVWSQRGPSLFCNRARRQRSCWASVEFDILVFSSS